jgi:hypothetical protein
MSRLMSVDMNYEVFLIVAFCFVCLRWLCEGAGLLFNRSSHVRQREKKMDVDELGRGRFLPSAYEPWMAGMTMNIHLRI